VRVDDHAVSRTNTDIGHLNHLAYRLGVTMVESDRRATVERANKGLRHERPCFTARRWQKGQESDLELAPCSGGVRRRGANNRVRLARATLQDQAFANQLDRDIVLLEAESEADLRRSHGSFFLTPDELADRLQPAV
jgi:hypothetical protein